MTDTTITAGELPASPGTAAGTPATPATPATPGLLHTPAGIDASSRQDHGMPEDRYTEHRHPDHRHPDHRHADHRHLDHSARTPLDAGAAQVATMPVTLHVRIPVDRFRLQMLADLVPGTVLTSLWPGSEDLPVSAGDVRIAWAEFAITDRTRSVRVTRIS